MTEQEKSLKIDKLIEQIDPINYERILLETRLHLIEKQPTSNEEEITQIKNKLNSFYLNLDPLFKQLRKLQSAYEIEYIGEISNPNPHWNNPEIELLYFSTDCRIDTVINGWDIYVGDTAANMLFREVHSYIFRQKYSNFCILNIRRK